MPTKDEWCGIPERNIPIGLRVHGPKKGDDAGMSKFVTTLLPYQAIHNIVTVHPTWGYRRVLAALRYDGWIVNHKRVRRYIREGKNS
jgi:hypothetical protein